MYAARRLELISSTLPRPAAAWIKAVISRIASAVASAAPAVSSEDASVRTADSSGGLRAQHAEGQQGGVESEEADLCRSEGRGPPGSLASASSAAAAWAFRGAVSAFVAQLLGERVRLACRLTTVSALLRQRPELRGGIDLLKVDVERSELSVLRGIEDGDWPSIRQVAMEVHDVDGQLQSVLNILKDKGGFGKVTAVQSSLLEGSTLWNVYCVR